MVNRPCTSQRTTAATSTYYGHPTCLQATLRVKALARGIPPLAKVKPYSPRTRYMALTVIIGGIRGTIRGRSIRITVIARMAPSCMQVEHGVPEPDAPPISQSPRAARTESRVPASFLADWDGGVSLFAQAHAHAHGNEKKHDHAVRARPGIAGAGVVLILFVKRAPARARLRVLRFCGMDGFEGEIAKTPR
jgi:hypothetical protein